MHSSTRLQHTIARPTTVSGFGYWSGLDVTVEFRPAEAGSGFTFVRRDLPGTPRVRASIENRSNVPRRTVLVERGTSVDMVEHVLAALVGLQIDNCEIWVDRAEMPGLDGSSQAYVRALNAATIVSQPKIKPVFATAQTIRLGNAEQWIQIEPAESGLWIDYQLDYAGQPAIGKQQFAGRLTPSMFTADLAASRTFILKHEVDALREQGFGRRTRYHDLLVFDERGPIDNQLRFVDECVRHKVLDVVGDLGLAPFEIVGKITAYRSGHALNGELVRRLCQSGSETNQLLRSA